MSDLDFAVRIGLERDGQFDGRRVGAAVTVHHLRRIAGLVEDGYRSLRRRFDSPGLRDALED